MITYYFRLQYRRLTRVITQIGLHPLAGIILIVAIFLGGSVLLFQKLAWAHYVYLILALFCVIAAGEKNRNEFLKNCFTPKDYKLIRIIENLILATPFFLILMLDHKCAMALILYLSAIPFSLFNVRTPSHFVIPTPFFHRPFEFTIGFRKTYCIFVLAYIITYISIVVDNYNLGLFALLIIFFTSLNYYTKPEPLFYVWVNALKPVPFLNNKIKTATIYSLLLSMPIYLYLALFNPGNIIVTSLIEIVGILWVINSLLGKYAYYPSEVNLTQGFITLFCLFIPPVLLISIPILYSRSKTNLDSILL